MVRLRSFFPKSHGKPRVDDLRIISHYLHQSQWLALARCAQEVCPPKALYNRWKRWSDKGVFARMMVGLASKAAVPKTVMIDATYLTTPRTATSLRSRKGVLETKGIA